MGLISLIAMSQSEMLLYRGKGEGEDKGESDSNDEAEYEKIEDNADPINDFILLSFLIALSYSGLCSNKCGNEHLFTDEL